MTATDQTNKKLTPEQQKLFDLLRAKLPTLKPARPAPAEPPAFELSVIQQRLAMLSFMDPDGSVANIPISSRLRGVVDVAALEKASNALLRRHASLRVGYKLQGDKITGFVIPAQDVPLAVYDLTHIADPAEREAEAKKQALAALRRRFHLDQPPLFRTLLWKLADDDYYFIMATHVTVVDGISMTILEREISLLYEVFACGAPPLPELKVEYSDFARWQREFLESDEYPRQLEHWKKKLSGAPAALDLPTDHTRTLNATHRGLRHRFVLQELLVERIRSFCQAEGATVYTALLAGYAALLHRYSGQDEVVLGTTITNRPKAEFEMVVGPFSNNLPLRVDMRGNPSFRELMRRVRDTILEAFSNQNLPFETLRDELGGDRDPRRFPIIQTVFVLHQMDHIKPPENPSVRFERTTIEREAAWFDIHAELKDYKKNIVGSVVYEADVYDTATIVRMFEHYRSLLASALSRPDQPIGRLSMLEHAEKRSAFEWFEKAAAAAVPGRPTPAVILDSHKNLVPPPVVADIYALPASGAPCDGDTIDAADLFGSVGEVEPGTLLCRTGWLGRYDASGTIEVLGPVESRVEIGGRRFGLWEVEDALRQDPTVRDAAVKLVDHPSGAPVLAAYVVRTDTFFPAPSRLRAFLQQSVPSFMTPTVFVFVDDLPRTEDGRLDRAALAPPPAEAFDRPDPTRARNPVEELLVRIWEETLRVSPIGIHDNFLELGGNSLLAMQIITRVNAQFNINLPIGTLLEATSIAALSEKMAAASQSTAPVVQKNFGRPAPLSEAQKRMWTFDAADPGIPVFNISQALRLEGPLDVAALERAYIDVIRRHDALRTNFRVIDGELLQVIGAEPTTTLSVDDLSALSAQEREARVEQITAGENRYRFDLAGEPLVRCRMLRLDASEWILIYTMHHIISDGWSAAIFFREMWDLYKAYIAGQPNPLKDITVQYADYALWQREQIANGAYDTQIAYWKQRLAGLETLDLPTDRPRSTERTYRAASLVLPISDATSERMRALIQREGVTLNMLLLAAYGMTVASWCEQPDLAVGSPVASRTRVEIENIIGMFAETLVLRMDLRGSRTFVDVLGKARDASLGAYANQDLPYEQLVEAFRPERDIRTDPFFRVWFDFVRLWWGAFDMANLRITPLEWNAEFAEFDIAFVLIDQAGSVSLKAVYSMDLFDEQTVGEIARQYVRLLDAVVEAPDADLGSLTGLTDRERRFFARLPGPDAAMSDTPLDFAGKA